MSFEAAAWAIRQRTKTPTDKLVLIVLADCQNDDTGLCFPSYAFIADRAQCSTRQVGRSLQSLEDCGLITRTGDKGRSNHYQLNTQDRTRPQKTAQDHIGQIVPSSEHRTSCPTTPDTMSHDIGHHVPPPRTSCPTNQEVTKKKTNNITKKLSADDLIEFGIDKQIAGDWLLIRKEKKLPLTTTALKQIEREAQKAGLTLANAIHFATAKGWAGFKADWFAKEKKQLTVTENSDSIGFIEKHTNTDWAKGL